MNNLKRRILIALAAIGYLLLLVNTIEYANSATNDTSDLVALNSGVVHIVGMRGQGSGVVVKEEQLGDKCLVQVVTARHVVQDNDGLFLADVDYVMTVKIEHSERDIALVYFEKKDNCKTNSITVVPIDYTNYPRGTPVSNIAYPYGAPFMGTGILGTTIPFPGNPMWESARWCFVWAAPGSSGSPVFVWGRVIGIIVAVNKGAPTSPYMLPIDNLKDIIH